MIQEHSSNKPHKTIFDMGAGVPVITRPPLATSKTVTSSRTPPGNVAGGGDGGLGELADLANNTDCCTTCLGGRTEGKGEGGGGGEEGQGGKDASGLGQ